MRKALAVRPYPGQLRQKVFRLLASVEVAVEAPPELGGSAGNDDIVRVLAEQRPELLLIPFHVVRNGGGERTTGLELLARLRQEVPRFRAIPVIMPVSLYARLAFEGFWRSRPEDHVFPVFEGELEAEGTRVALAGFLLDGRR